MFYTWALGSEPRNVVTTRRSEIFCGMEVDSYVYSVFRGVGCRERWLYCLPYSFLVFFLLLHIVVFLSAKSGKGMIERGGSICSCSVCRRFLSLSFGKLTLREDFCILNGVFS